MAISVLGVRGTTGVFGGTGTGDSTCPSFTSTAGSTLIVVLSFFHSNGTPSGSDIADSKSNTYTIVNFTHGGVNAVGIAAYYNIGGTRGASHTITGTPVGGSNQSASNIAVIEISAAGTISFDGTTDAVATDSTSAYTVTAAAAIAGTQIGVYGCTLDIGNSAAFTQPTGYSNIFNEPDGTANLVSIASYKNPETGTPAPGATRSGTAADGREIFCSFLETGGATTSLPMDSRLRRNVLLRR